MLAPTPPGCSLATYPPAGGNGKAANACDEWPYVSKTTVKGCACPPQKDAYGWRKAALFANVIPFVGQIFNSALGMPGNCQNEFKDSANVYRDAQTAFTAALSSIGQWTQSIINVFMDIYTPDTASGTATGILPATIKVAMQPGMHTSALLGIICVAVFFVLLGVIFTM